MTFITKEQSNCGDPLESKSVIALVLDVNREGEAVAILLKANLSSRGEAVAILL